MGITTQEVDITETEEAGQVIHIATIHLSTKSIDVELALEPFDNEIYLLQDEGMEIFVVGYLVYDEEYNDEDERDWDIVTTHKDARREDHRKYQLARGMDGDWNRDSNLKPNPYAVLLDIYNHGGQVYSVSGEGYYCRWDTACGGGIWIPSDELIENMKAGCIPPEGEREFMVQCARSACEHLNCIENGDVWGIVIERFNYEGKREKEESHWGFVGGECAKTELKYEMKGMLQ